MKVRKLLLLAIAVLLVPAVVFGALNGVVIPEGTLVRIRLDQNLNTKTNRTGDSVAFTVVDPIFLNGRRVIERGALAAAQLEKVRGPGRFGRDASLKLRYLFVMATDRSEVPIALGERSVKTNESMGLALGASAAGFLVLGPLGLIGGGLVKGKHIDIPAGTELVVEVPHDVVL